MKFHIAFWRHIMKMLLIIFTQEDDLQKHLNSPLQALKLLRKLELYLFGQLTQAAVRKN